MKPHLLLQGKQIAHNSFGLQGCRHKAVFGIGIDEYLKGIPYIKII